MLAEIAERQILTNSAEKVNESTDRLKEILTNIYNHLDDMKYRTLRVSKMKNLQELYGINSSLKVFGFEFDPKYRKKRENTTETMDVFPAWHKPPKEDDATDLEKHIVLAGWYRHARTVSFLNCKPIHVRMLPN